MKTQNTYKNPWQKGAKNGSPAIYQNNAPCVFEHRGVKVFKLNESSFDFVLGDCAIAQRAGASKAKEVIDGILGRDPGMYICEAVLTHLAAHGIEVLKKPIHGEDIPLWQNYDAHKL